MAKTDDLEDFMTDLADSIREATGETGSINAQSFSTRITGLGTGKQDKLVSGENIKTINGESILGSGNISISGGGGSSSGSVVWQAERIPQNTQYLTLSPFTLYYGGTIYDRVTIEFDTAGYDYADYRALMFLGANSSLTFNYNVCWPNGSAPNFEAGNYELKVTYDVFEDMFYAVLIRFE